MSTTVNNQYADRPYLGIGVFVLGMILVIVIIYINEKIYTYNNQGCRIDSNGNQVSEPIYSRIGNTRKKIGYNNCVKKTSSIIILLFGLFFSAISGFFVAYAKLINNTNN